MPLTRPICTEPPLVPVRSVEAEMSWMTFVPAPTTVPLWEAPKLRSLACEIGITLIAVDKAAASRCGGQAGGKVRSLSSGAMTTNFERSKAMCRSICGKVPLPIEPKPIITIGPTKRACSGQLSVVVVMAGLHCLAPSCVHVRTHPRGLTRDETRTCLHAPARLTRDETRQSVEAGAEICRGSGGFGRDDTAGRAKTPA
jgi:hypothetical protein